MKINKKSLLAGVMALFLCASVGLGVSAAAETAGATKSNTPQKTVTAIENRAYYAGNEDSIVEYGSDPNSIMTGIKAQLALYDSVTIRNVIDLEEMNKKDQNFIFLHPVVAEPGRAEYTKITVEVIDAYDPTNFIKIIINCTPQNEDASTIAYFLAGASNGQKPTGYEDGVEKLHVNNEYGQWSPFTFSSHLAHNSGAGFFYDTDEKKLFAVDTRNGRRRIIDFDDPMHFGTNLWDGFTTNEVYCRITCSSYKTDKASIMISQYGDYDLTNPEIYDVVAPALSIDYGEYTKDTVPNALAREKYKIFDASSFDTIDGVVETQVKVYTDYYSAKKSEVAVRSGKFTPKLTQPHYIEYTAVDAHGNESQEVFMINVVSSCDPLSIDFDNVLYTTVEGDAYPIPDYTVSGGLGKVKLTMKATLNGKEIAIDRGVVRPYASGTMKIVYSLEDYIGQEYEVEHEITVTDAVKPTFIETPLLPKYLIAKNSYMLPALNAYDYVTAEGTAIPTTVSVVENGETKSITDNTYVVGEGVTEAEIIYTASIGNAVNEYRKVLPVYDVYEGEDLAMGKFFLPSGNGSATAIDYSVKLTANGDESFEFLNYVSALNLFTEFSLQDSSMTFRKFHITLTDILDSNRQLKFTYVFNSDSIAFYLNDNEASTVPVTGKPAKDLRMYMCFNTEERKVFYDISNANVLPIFTFLNGETFDGFSENRAYITYAFEDVKTSANMAIHTLNGHYFSEETRDWIAPLIEMTGDVGGEYTLWDEIALPIIIANDILSGDVKAYVTLTDPNGNYLTTVDGRVLNELVYDYSVLKVVFAAYGDYVLLITTQDMNGNLAQIPVVYSVVDKVKPTLTVPGEIATTAKVGDNIKLPTATVTDNLGNDLEISVYVIAPTGHIIKIKDERGFTATQTGVYVVTYSVSDEEGNFDFKYYTITVTEG